MVLVSIRQIDLVKVYATKNCLVIDDMSEVRGTLSRMLRTFGIKEIKTAANGEDAIEICRDKHYDIVLCDYNLGSGKDGQQVLEELRFRNRLNNTSMFLMITAEAGRDMVLGALEYQPDDYITKPFTQASLHQRLNRALIRHQELYGVKEALDEKDYQKVIDRCDDLIDNQTQYQNACLQIKAEMSLRLFKPEQAEQIYNDVLHKHPVIWAKLGLGKAQLAKEELNKAESTLKDVINVDRRYVEAHDLLAKTYLAKGDTYKAQEAVQEAAEVSPKSILRQRRLAELAKDNDDVEVSLKARRKTLRLGQNSCYESASDYIGLTRELAEQSKDNLTSEGKEHAKEAFDLLRRLEKKKYYDADADLQSKSLKARVSAGQHKEAEAEVYLNQAKETYAESEDLFSPEARLEFIESVLESGDKDQGNTLLTKLAQEYSENEEILEKIDGMSDEAISTVGRKKASTLTKSGINFYEQKQFAEAITTFKNAVSIFPKHIGLNLNLIQVTLAEAKQNGDQPGFEKICQKSLKAISQISPDDSQFSRYEFLAKQVQQRYPENAE